MAVLASTAAFVALTTAITVIGAAQRRQTWLERAPRQFSAAKAEAATQGLTMLPGTVAEWLAEVPSPSEAGGGVAR